MALKCCQCEILTYMVHALDMQLLAFSCISEIGFWPLECSKENSTGFKQELPKPEMCQKSEQNTVYRD